MPNAQSPAVIETPGNYASCRNSLESIAARGDHGGSDSGLPWNRRERMRAQGFDWDRVQVHYGAFKFGKSTDKPMVPSMKKQLLGVKRKRVLCPTNLSPRWREGTRHQDLQTCPLHPYRYSSVATGAEVPGICDHLNTLLSNLCFFYFIVLQVLIIFV